MRAAWYERTGPARDVLIVGTLPDPEPGPGEVRVRIVSSGANPSDWKARSGVRPMIGPKVVPHSDGAGVIDRVGAGVSGSRVGGRVWVWNGQWNRAFGTAAEFIVVPEAQAVPLPDAVGFDEGACFGIPALTAHRAVTVDGDPKGSTVLVTGGAGSVGHYAIRMAKLSGAAKVLTTVSSPEKAAHARAAGADVTIDYRNESVVERVLEETGGQGVDRVVEVDVAGNAKILPRIVRRDGICAIYGSSKPEATFDFVPMIMSGAALRFFIVYELPEEARLRGIRDITRWASDGLLLHTIAARFPLDRIVDAHEAVEAGRQIGNVVVHP